MKRTKLLKTQPCEAPRISSEEDVICASQIVEADGEKALEISLFYKGKLRGRYFADEENHNAWIDGKWYTLRLKNVIRVCMDASPLKNDYYYCTPSTKWAAPEDKERAYDFLDTYGIEDYEVRLGARKRQKAFERKLERIDQMMADVPCVPEDAETWMENEIFPENILFFKKGEKRITYSCTACGATSWRKKAWKHGEKTVCPKCGRPVTANCRQQERTRKEPIVILQQYGSGWIERQFRAICRWSYGEKKEIQLNEEIRAIIPEGQHWGKVWYGTMYNADEFEQEFWDKNGLNKHFLSSYLYPRDLPETLKRGNLEHSGMDLLAARREKFNVNKYITTFYKRPYLEYLAKAGLTRLAAEIVNTYGWWREPSTIFQCGDTMVDVLQIDGNRVNRMKQINGGLHALEWLQYEEDMGVKISQESLEYLEKKKVGLDGCRPILQEVKSVNRMVNYMKKQKGEISKLCITWADYLRMAKAEGYDTTDDIVRFPRDLKARHNELVELDNKRKDEKRLQEYRELDQQIKERLPEAARYFWEDEKYMIIPAGKCEELINEGRTLHHCVGRDDHYMKKMAAGTSWILFLRKKEDLETPYYTLEIDMQQDRILQYYSEFDRQPDKPIITKVLDKFRKGIRRQQNRIRTQVAAIA